jgi:hypothetical protein
MIISEAVMTTPSTLITIASDSSNRYLLASASPSFKLANATSVNPTKVVAQAIAKVMSPNVE